MNSRFGSEAHHCVHVAGRLGMVRETVKVQSIECAQCFVVQVQPAVRCDRLLDGEPRELMAEADACRVGDEHARGQAFIKGFHHVTTCKSSQKPEARVMWNDGHRVEQPPRVGAQPRGSSQHRIPDGVRNFIRAGCERLDDEERVAARLPKQLLPVDAERLGQLSDRGKREWRDLDAVHDGAGRELAQHDPQRMLAVELVVAIGRDHQRRN